MQKNIDPEKCLVIDVDDTISITKNRDYENAKPIVKIINKINKLHDKGWHITLFSARGQLSKKGDIKLIETINRPVLENWLKKNNVKYDKLLFNKPYAVFYIDDKAMTPELFLKTPFK